MKTLERRYSKSDRIIIKARFSTWVYLRIIILGAILGGAVAAIWIFNSQIENLILKTNQPVQYLTDDVMKWAVLGVGLFVLLCFILQTISLYSRELIVTEDKLVYRVGVLSIKSADINLSTVKSVEYKANIISRILRYGTISIIVDAQNPYTIKGVAGADRLAKRIMQQVSKNANDRERQLVNMKLVGSVPKKKH